jgi:hypothetical protein
MPILDRSSGTSRLTISSPVLKDFVCEFLTQGTSSVNRGGVRQVLQEGVIGLKSGGKKTFVLATEPTLIAANKEVRVRLACTGPL